MALLDRVKERIETDIGDAELQRLVDEALQAIVDRWGAHADAASPVTERFEGDGLWLFPTRPVDDNQTVTVTETSGDTETALAADDFEVWDRGRSLRRLSGGTNSRSRWAPSVEVTYTPRQDGNRRQEAVIKLVRLGIQYRGLERESIGDTTDDHLDYNQERERILTSLAPSAFGVR